MVICFTCKGRNDGIGAQACAIISVMVVAKAFGLEFVYTPMKYVAHYPHPNPTLTEKLLWCRAWEQLLNFSFENKLLAQTSGSRLHLDHKTITSHFKLDKYSNKFSTNLRPYNVYSTRETHDVLTKYHNHPNINEAWKFVLNRIRKGYARDRTNTPHFDKDPCTINITVHVRRGDATNISKRFVNHSYFVNVLESIVEQLHKIQKKYDIIVYSEGSVSDFPEFHKFKNIHYRLNDDQFDTLHHMICSDILIMSKSTFSYLPALLNNKGLIIYNPFWLLPPKPLEHVWIIPDKDGNLLFDTKMLRK